MTATTKTVHPSVQKDPIPLEAKNLDVYHTLAVASEHMGDYAAAIDILQSFATLLSYGIDTSLKDVEQLFE